MKQLQQCVNEEKQKLEFYLDLPPNKSSAIKQIESVQNENVIFLKLTIAVSKMKEKNLNPSRILQRNFL